MPILLIITSMTNMTGFQLVVATTHSSQLLFPDQNLQFQNLSSLFHFTSSFTQSFILVHLCNNQVSGLVT